MPVRQRCVAELTNAKLACMTDKWLTIEQIADYLQVSTEKLYKLCQKGKMPASKVGGQWRFDLKEVDAWVRRQRPGKMRSKNSCKG